MIIAESLYDALFMKKVRKVVKSIYFGYLNNFWKLRKRRGSDDFGGVAHILLVKNVQYVAFAKICVNSFLSFHQKSKVVVHCDSVTYSLAKSKLSKSFFFGEIEVLLDQDEFQTWQSLKAALIISMANSHDVYMDADLRWRSSIVRLRTLTFLVDEFDFRGNSTFVKLLGCSIFKNLQNPKMRNTSFATFGGIQVDPGISTEILETVENFAKILSSLNFSEEEITALNRLSEQITISLLSEKITSEIKFLKISDSRLDKGIVESPYFGSTGLGF